MVELKFYNTLLIAFIFKPESSVEERAITADGCWLKLMKGKSGLHLFHYYLVDLEEDMHIFGVVIILPEEKILRNKILSKSIASM